MAVWILSGVAQAAGPSCAVNDAEIVARTPSSVVAPTNGMTVIQVDPTFPLDGLSASGFEVKTAKQFYGGNRWQDPDVRLRDRLLKEAGLDPFVKGWRALERDFIFLRAQEQSLERMVFKYPRIPKERLAALKVLIAGEKAAEL